MNISDLITKTRYTLQDTAKNRYTDEEIYVYIDDAIRDIALRTMYNRISQDIIVVDGQTTYGLTSEAIKFASISTAQTYEIQDPTTIIFEDSTAEDVTIEYYAFPDRIVYGVDTVLSLDEDMYDLVRMFVLARCYEKEDSTELMQKAQYFMNRYRDYLNQNLTRWHGDLEVTLAKNDFYT